ncbi:MAG: hypothetical protein K2H38_10905, partial [Muribaculaceae bacterium]|nr:hypothetical protein [Muribaculaceae bacterium]
LPWATQYWDARGRARSALTTLGTERGGWNRTSMGYAVLGRAGTRTECANYSWDGAGRLEPHFHGLRSIGTRGDAHGVR